MYSTAEVAAERRPEEAAAEAEVEQGAKLEELEA
jgi:hypothetical protein